MPKVELAGIHHNPTPGPMGSEFLYGHVWVTISWLVTHPAWGCIGLPLRALMYVRRKDLQAMQNTGRSPWLFRTKLDLAAELVEWCIELLRNAFQKRVMVIVNARASAETLIRQMYKMIDWNVEIEWESSSHHN